MTALFTEYQKRYSVKYKNHTLTFSPVFRLWHITGPKLTAAFARSLEDAEDEVTFWLARLKAHQTMNFARADY